MTNSEEKFSSHDVEDSLRGFVLGTIRMHQGMLAASPLTSDEDRLAVENFLKAIDLELSELEHLLQPIRNIEPLRAAKIDYHLGCILKILVALCTNVKLNEMGHDHFENEFKPAVGKMATSKAREPAATRRAVNDEVVQAAAKDYLDRCRQGKLWDGSISAFAKKLKPDVDAALEKRGVSKMKESAIRNRLKPFVTPRAL